MISFVYNSKINTEERTMNDEETKKWPLYKDKMLIIGNPKSQVAVCSLWTKKELVAQKLNLEKISVIGNLYSAKKGINFLIRNILANPKIGHLIICGLDKSRSGQALIDLAKNGFEKVENKEGKSIYWQIISSVENRIDIEIEKEALEIFRSKVKIMDLRREKDYAKIQKIIDSLDQNLPPFAEKPLLFPDRIQEETDFFPSESSAFTIRGRKIANVWLQILDSILKFGISDETAYQNNQKEIIDIISVISNEDPDNLYVPEWMPITRVHLDSYFPTILSGNCPIDSSYTYGSRMRSYFDVDQIQKVIDELKDMKYSRRTAISLFDPRVDMDSENPPCINHYWFRIQNNKLYFVVTIRSNDMFEAWPQNAFGLRMLQNLVYKELMKTYPEIKLGDLIIHSLSAHIYDDSWEDARQIVERYYEQEVTHPRNLRDPRGNFIIRVENDEIVAEHYSPDEVLLKAYKNKRAMPLYVEISRNNTVSVISHALYLGTELQKAEMAIKFGLRYEQDNGLDAEKLGGS